MDRLLAPQRRLWLLLTLTTITLMFTWSSVNNLAVLIEAEPELPTTGTLLQRAEHNIASHLHLKEGVASECRQADRRPDCTAPPLWRCRRCRRRRWHLWRVLI